MHVSTYLYATDSSNDRVIWAGVVLGVSPMRQAQAQLSLIGAFKKQNKKQGVQREYLRGNAICFLQELTHQFDPERF